MNNKPLIPKGGNDSVMTPLDLAKKIINYLPINSYDWILEPCRGTGAFYNNFPRGVFKDWAEIGERRDFLTYKFNKLDKFDWIVTNPPYSKFRPFLRRSMELADNVVFLCLVNAFFMKARLRDMKEFNFTFKEIMFVDTPKEWPQMGIQLGVVWIQEDYMGECKIGKL